MDVNVIFTNIISYNLCYLQLPISPVTCMSVDILIASLGFKTTELILIISSKHWNSKVADAVTVAATMSFKAESPGKNSYMLTFLS
ncbi:hypothetical protein VNO77_17689 [Canavalia gladiata]|uniref:Uncharacterized protein n=1 Tax=Canavalia gladiata TaxID=3824 RepID=A0AAN9QIX8_CANGL